MSVPGTITITVDIKSLECPICLSRLTCPVITGCKHTFCQSCITEARKSSNDCPICYVNITSLVLDHASFLATNTKRQENKDIKEDKETTIDENVVDRYG